MFLEKSSQPGINEAWGEALLFSLYAARNVVNASRPVAESLATALSGLTATGTEYGGCRLVAFPGHGGRKGFTARVSVVGNPREVAPRFDLRPRGFGLRGQGLEYYGPVSTVLLALYLADRRMGGFDRVIEGAARELAKFFWRGDLTLPSQVAYAVGATELAWHNAQQAT